MIQFSSSGSFNNTESFLKRMRSNSISNILKNYGDQGVRALENATPIDTSETRNSWYYQIEQTPGQYTISFRNRHVVDGVPIAIILQYGHGTGTGGYVQGRDYINPAIQPIFDKIVDEVWKAVTK